MWLNKTSSDGTFLGRTSTRLLWCWLLLLFFSSLKVFTLSGYFSMPPALHPAFSGRWRPPPARSSTLAIFGCFTFARLFRHSSTANATILSGHFLPTGAFYLVLLPHILTRFVTHMPAGTLHSGSSSVSALTELSLPADPWTWTTHILVTRPLIYKFRQWATKYRVNLNYWICFGCSKSYGKTIKTPWTKFDRTFCLKLLWQNSLKLFLKSSHLESRQVS